MTDAAIRQALRDYAKACREDRIANPHIGGDGAALELLLAPRFKTLIERLLPLCGSPIAPRVLSEYTKKSVGRPDLALARPQSRAHAFIELKEPGKPLDPKRLKGHDARQFSRFCDLPVWAISNFHGIRLFQRNRVQSEALVVAASTLDPDTSDTKAERLIETQDLGPLRQIVGKRCFQATSAVTAGAA